MLKTNLRRIFKKWFPTEPKGWTNWRWRALNKAAQESDKSQDERRKKTVSKSLAEHTAQMHPGFQYLIEAFLKHSTRKPIPAKDPMDKLLLKGEGFIPTPDKYSIVTNTLVHSMRNSFLLNFVSGHPGGDSTIAKTYQMQMARICADVQIKDNLPQDEREALRKATKDKNNVFVPTDKTGKIIRVKRSTMAGCIETFIGERRGQAFDIIDDPITLAIALNQHKRKVNTTIDLFRYEKEKMEAGWDRQRLQKQYAKNFIINNVPTNVHGVKFPNGITATDKIIKILTKEAHFLPSFGPLKPHIKDHKLQKSILEIIKEAEEKNTIPKIPLRLTHKATCGPTAGLAEIIGPILENLASCCKLALTQASEDVAEFLAKVIFTEKPAFGAVDVNDAFWAMAKKTCLQRVRRLANRYPEILQSFGITPDGLIAAIELIWEDNFFVALGANGPIHGRINGCTMGNIISMALCRIYYFCSLEEAINKVGKEKFIYVKSGGDDALILAWKETDIEELITQLNLLPDNWTYELRKLRMEASPSLTRDLPSDLQTKANGSLIQECTSNPQTFLTEHMPPLSGAGTTRKHY